ncbi:S8 family serine peptidase [Ferruginibacter sp. SUN106]|uniref:S8 family serine peptidase n=1 Tax=Ferruginibacter sp. SUN106 TaxID=2978348 RepID=UPI003D35ECE1
MKRILLLLLVIFFANYSFSQSTRFIIRFKDKGTSPYSLSNPSVYLTNRAIQRRTRYNLAIDSSDLPITPRYIDSIRLAGAVTILNSSKWLNQVAIQTTDVNALNKISTFSFVISTAPIAALIQPTEVPVNKQLDAAGNFAPGDHLPQNTISDYYSYGQSFGQVHLHNGEFLHNRGFRGDGMQMAILDAGFYHYLSLPTFDSIRNNNQVLGTWDFVAGNASVDEDHTHGMNCLSTIAANMPGVFMGTAPKTSFYLYRTEDVNSEYPIEEQNWAAGIEKADSLGVDVCSTSLGYFTFDNAAFNHTYADMDGNTTLIAKAADMAAKKGMLIVVAAGNEGTSSWHYIITPADADSVMAVGAVTTAGVVGGFSSFGPSSDGQVKPSVAAVGVGAVIANSSNGLPTFGNGTSFACPNMAGLSTCLWQAFPEVNNMTIINTLQQSATKAANPDDRVGYGIPDMKKSFVMLINQLHSQQVAVSNCKTNLQWNVKTDSVINLVVERKLPADINYIPLNTLSSTGAFAARNFTYTDDLAAITSTTIKYRLKVNIASDTSFYIDSATVNFVPKPNLGNDKSITRCSDSSLNLTTLYSTTGLTALWTLNTIAVANPSAVSVSGIYQLTGNNTSGCADTALVTLNFIAKPNLGADKVVAKCTDSSFNLTTLFTTTGLTPSWTIGGASVTTPAAVNVAGTYRLIVVNTSGCSDTALVTLNNDPQLCPVIIDKITISPNPVSDKLKVVVTNKNAIKVELAIYNALGEKMYSTTGQQAAGTQTYTIPMKQMASGVYYVLVFVNDKKEMVKQIVNR